MATIASSSISLLSPAGLRVAPQQKAVVVSKVNSSSRPAIIKASAAAAPSGAKSLAAGLAAVSLSALLQLSPLSVEPARANEYDILNAAPPAETHFLDDASVLSRLTKSDLKRLLSDLEERTGYHLDVVTIRKLTSKGDVFDFTDQVLERWYPTIEEGNKKAVLLLVTTTKEGAVSGGPAFQKAVGDSLLEAVVSENLPVLATDEKYNEAVYSSAKRIVARLNGQPDIPGPQFDDKKRESNFKTKEETSEKRGQFSFVVGGLLVIAFVVPMAQYYAYVSKK